jgi:hypothetical protein
MHRLPNPYCLYVIPCLVLVILLASANASVLYAISPLDSPADELVQIASKNPQLKKLRPLSPCETRLLRAAATGDVADCGRHQGTSDEVSPDNGSSGRPGNLRAQLVRWLIVDPIASKLVTPQGLQVRGAYVGDFLDLSSLVVGFPLSFKNSRFAAGIDLSHSRLINLDASGTHLYAVYAEGVSVRDDFRLPNVNSEGGIYLTKANVGGFDLSGSHLHGVYAEGVRVRDDFSLSNVSSEGEIYLTKANVGGDLSLLRSTLTGDYGTALAASDLTVSGDVNFSGAADSKGTFVPFTAKGKVVLERANIGNDLICRAGKFESRDDIALDARMLKGQHDVLLTGTFDKETKRPFHPFIANARVVLEHADIAGMLDGDGGTFKSSPADPDRIAVNAKDLRVGSLSLRSVHDSQGNKDIEVDGTFDLSGAQVTDQLAISLGYRPQDWKLNLNRANTVEFLDNDGPQPQIDVRGFVYVRLNVVTKDKLQWLQQQEKPFGFAQQPYQQLASVLRGEGNSAGAQDVLIAMEEDRDRNAQWSLDRLWNWILWLTMGYGYAPLRALKWLAGLLSLGWVFFKCGYKHNWIVATEPDPKLKLFEPFSPFIYSLESLLPLVDLNQAKHYIPDGNTPGGRWLRRYLWLHAIAGLFFTSKFILGATIGQAF